MKKFLIVVLVAIFGLTSISCSQQNNANATVTAAATYIEATPEAEYLPAESDTVQIEQAQENMAEALEGMATQLMAPLFNKSLNFYFDAITVELDECNGLPIGQPQFNFGYIESPVVVGKNGISFSRGEQSILLEYPVSMWIEEPDSGNWYRLDFCLNKDEVFFNLTKD